MKERPIIFSGPMVRAILNGTKTQTRRIAKLNAAGRVELYGRHDDFAYGACPYGKTGERLWVRETFAIESNRCIEPESVYPPPFNDGRPIDRVDTPDECYWSQCHYRASDPAPELWCEDSDNDEPCCKWKPSIYMPRWASRILLEITNVRVERLQDVSEADALDEGITYNDIPNNGLDPMRARRWYRNLWESINGAGSWDANPWVWVVEFNVVTNNKRKQA